MSCEGCANKNESPKEVPYIVYEASMGRAERIIKRLIIALIAAVILIFASNGIWLWYFSGFDVESYELTTDDGGNANYIGNDGDIYNGEGQGS